MKYAVVYGSVRTERVGIRAAKFVVQQLEKRGHEVTLIDPKETPLPLLDKRFMDYENDVPENIQLIHDILENTDGIVLVSGEYNSSVPPALKNMLDHFMDEYAQKPCGIVTYSTGPFGGVRVLEQLRNIVANLGMVSVPKYFPISGVQKVFDENGGVLDENYERRISAFLDELEWYTEALAEKRKKRTTFLCSDARS